MALCMVGTVGYYVYVKFNDYWPYCYFIVRGTVMTSGRPSPMLIWVGVFVA